ncbi:MAG: GNAT family N-acetyltransferase [Candidatus Limnocylindrales bacterium]
MNDTARWIDVPGAPAIERLRFRAYGGDGDIAGMAEVIRAANLANHESEYVSDDYLRSQVLNFSHFPPQQARLLALVDERIVACSVFEQEDTTAGVRNYSSYGHVHPEWRRRGLGSAMARWNEARLLEIASEQRHPGGAALTTWIEEADVGGTAIAVSLGYTRTRVGYHMVRPDLEDIDVPPLPRGLVVRRVGPDDLSRVWDAMIEAFRDHHGGHDGSEAAFKRWTDDPVFDIELLIVAFARDEVAGGVQGWVDPDENAANGYRRGWTDPVFTRRPWRRMGLAHALLGRALAAIRARGMTSAQLGVDAENPYQALTLYERHRFATVRTGSEWTRAIDPEAR